MSLQHGGFCHVHCHLFCCVHSIALTLVQGLPPPADRCDRLPLFDSLFDSLPAFLHCTPQALLHTLAVSGTAAGVDMLVKLLYITALHVPLFLYNPAGDMAWSKWSFWLVHSLIALLAYGAMVALPFTPWRELLPAKASFYGYALCLLGMYITMAVGSILVGCKLVGGYCVYGSATWLYYSCYPPLVYFTFLAEFFGEEELDTDLLLYSEMRDAGVFDDGAQELSFG